MGAMQNNPEGSKKSSRKRGSVNNKHRLESFARASASSGADWGGCNPDKLQAVVVGITILGGAITLGLSRDMGAHSLTLLLDGGRETLWFNADADLNDELDEVAGKLEAMR